MSLLTNTFWLGDTESFNHIFSIEEKIQKLMNASVEKGIKFDMYADHPIEEEEEDLHKMMGSIAVLPVNGSLISKDTWLSKLFGVTSYEGVKKSMLKIADLGESTRLVLDIGSGGGNSQGIDELGLFIKKFDSEIMPVHAYTSTTMHSSAYWMGASCRDITCTSMSSLASIGVVMVHKEVSKRLKDQGIKVHMFRDGEFKAKPNMYEKLDAKTIEMVDKSLKIMGGFFLDWVAQERNFDRDSVRQAVGEGRTFFGGESVSNGLADRIMFFDDFIKKLQIIDSIEEPRETINTSISTQFGQVSETSLLLSLNSMVEKFDHNNQPDEITGNNEEEADMSVSNTDAGDTTGKKISTPKGDLSLEQVQAALELGTLKMTEELKSKIEEIQLLSPDNSTGSEDNQEESNSETTEDSPNNSMNDNRASDDIVSHIQTQLNDQISSNVKLQISLDQAKMSMDAMVENLGSLTNIAVVSCQKMGLLVGGAKVDYSAMDLNTLLSTHSSMASTIEKEFKIGGVAAVPVDNEHADGTNQNNNMAVPLSVVSFNNQ